MGTSRLGSKPPSKLSTLEGGLRSYYSLAAAMTRPRLTIFRWIGMEALRAGTKKASFSLSMAWIRLVADIEVVILAPA